MLVYKYTALSNEGSKTTGSIFVDNYKDAYNSLLSRQYLPISLEKINLSHKKVDLEDLFAFFLHLDLQLKCKIRINDAIESFLKLHSNSVLKTSLLTVIFELKSGSSLYEAFEKCNFIFDDMVIGLLKAAEKTGKISDIISNILKFLKMQSACKSHVRQAIIYPIFNASVAIFVLFMSVNFLGDQITSLINEYGEENISILTKFLIYSLPYISEIFSYFIPIVFCLLAFFVFNQNTKLILITLMMRIPKIGPLIGKIYFWQFCELIHIALNSKLNFMEAMSIAIGSIKIKNIKNRLLKIRASIADGYSIVQSFSNEKFISNSIISAIGIGEESNDLQCCFKHIGEDQYAKILSDIKKLGHCLSVGIILFTGLVFVVILYGLFSPMYNYIEITGI
jgi:type IV pilus assembly protein PilC